MKSNDTQFEAMASYFRSMLNPVSSQEIEEKLAGKLASSGLVADGVVKVSSEQNRPEESPVIEESVKVTDESSDVAETDGRESETEQKNSTASDADQSCQIPVIQAEKSQERDEIKNGTGEKPEAISSEEKNTDASGIENEHDLSAEPQKQDTVQKQPETHADLLSTENTQKSEQQTETQLDAAKGTTDAVTPADGAIVASFGKTYTPKADDSFIDRESAHRTFNAPSPSSFDIAGAENKSPQIMASVQKEAESRPVLEPRKETLDKLSRIISQIKPEVKTQTETETKTEVKTEIVTITAPRVKNFASSKVEEETKQTTELKQQVVQDVARPATAQWSNIQTPEEFQALFFVLDKITFAVPLIDLGSINNIEKITPIFGKPEWFMGMMNVRDEKVQIVDFAKWAMPQIAVDPDSFQYVIELGNSKWGITCTGLIGTETLRRSQVQWRSSSGKRPWLAGIVKERMCALIHVTELVKLFKNGVNIDGN